MSSIVVTGAAKAFDRRVLFENLSFKVAGGQMTALTGASGSGKSTLLNCLGLLETLTRGSIEVDGVDIARLRPELRRRFRRDTLGYLFQNYALIENASIRTNLEVAVGALPRVKRSVDFDAALVQVGLGGRGKEPVYRLSGGEQQRVALARLLVKRPSVILADEPTGALDDANAAMVLDSLHTLAEAGAAVVIATHSATVVEACADVIRL
ncbi:ATP-binding cassette domain-containing protein [Promicromonospora sp. NPDC057488]|uniref:ATP-binding cassette domain-containing protein n=1 Tax=Promicromonospora sp. NPDC057488 TaxID=3346147 RepID=UPI00366CA580